MLFENGIDYKPEILGKGITTLVPGNAFRMVPSMMFGLVL
jgi:hypothetical protein